MEELPSEMTKEENVTGIPDPWCESVGASS
jgi:hypothetical protein